MTTETRQAKKVEPQAGDKFITTRLRLSGVLIISGVLVQGISLFWNHPLSFLAFIGIGSLAVFCGMVVYLFALVSPRTS
jgi:hypothetical protein